MFTRIRKFFQGLREMGQRLQHLDKREQELVSQMTPDEATICLKDAQTEKMRGGAKPATSAGGGPKAIAFVLFACLALAVEGCSSADTVKDADRVVVEYNRQMWAQVGVIASGLGGSAPDAAAALAVLAADGTAAA